MTLDAVILDLWIPTAFKGKGRPMFRTIPRSSEVEPIIADVPDPKNEGRLKPTKHYKLSDLRPHAYSHTTQAFETALTEEIEIQVIAAKNFQILRGPVRVDWCAYYHPPLSYHPRDQRAAIAGDVAYLKKPDRDNLEKMLLDAANTLVFMDDVQVVFGTGAKMYSDREGLRAHFSAIEPQEVKQWADDRFKWPEEEFNLVG